MTEHSAPEVPTTPDVVELRERHAQMPPGFDDYCVEDGELWPCAVTRLLDERDRLREALRTMHADNWNVERGDHRPGDHPDDCYVCAALVGHGMALRGSEAAPDGGEVRDGGCRIDAPHWHGQGGETGDETYHLGAHDE
jgi:hypothetical protein